MRKGVKFRAYPNKEQINLINQTFGCCRLIYNKGLAMRNDGYTKGQKVNYNDTSAMLTELKKTEEFAFLKLVDSMALQQSLRDLDRGFVNFFEKRASHPQFKSKHSSHQSYRTLNQDNNIRITGNRIKLPKLGYVKIKQSMRVGKINNVTIERTPTGKYFVVLNVDFEPELRPNNGGSIGIDVGIKEFYTESRGNVVDNPKYLEKSMRKLKREQRKLSRMIESHIIGYKKGKKGGRIPVYDKPLNECTNVQKQRMVVAKLHEKISNQRNDFLQKQSTMLVRENQTICIEDLNVKGMVKNHKLAQHISSVSWSKFFDMLEYKAQWYGNDIIRIPAMYPSSQICSCCGYKYPLVKNLYIRKWTCPNCGILHDRNINAGINILNKGLELLTA
ncbi:MAG: IS200/IS605 family element RNA-guided endonuclease TnpB [Erysipelotrichaceae bacterium]|nr:IS200/IS605 family element RNA-guided endonuclease TnpB [Erysipelotrichaceae bacterium]